MPDNEREERHERRNIRFIDVNEIVKEQIERLAWERAPHMLPEEVEREKEKIIEKIPTFHSIVANIRYYDTNINMLVTKICNTPVRQASEMSVGDIVDCNKIREIITGVIFSVDPKVFNEVEEIINDVGAGAIPPDEGLVRLVDILNRYGIPVKGPYDKVAPIKVPEDVEDVITIVTARRPQFIKYLERLIRESAKAIRRMLEEEEGREEEAERGEEQREEEQVRFPQPEEAEEEEEAAPEQTPEEEEEEFTFQGVPEHEQREEEGEAEEQNEEGEEEDLSELEELGEELDEEEGEREEEGW